MSIKENCPGVAAPGQQMALDGFGETIHTDRNYITARGAIASLLSPGKDNALHLRELMAITGLDSRTVRQMIQRERLEGEQILSDNMSGYFLPGSEEEKKHFVRSMLRRAREIQAVAEAVHRSGVE